MHSEENTHILHITIKKYYNIFKTHIYLRISRKCGRSETIQTDATNIFESLGFRGEKKRPFISQTNKIKRKHHAKASITWEKRVRIHFTNRKKEGNWKLNEMLKKYFSTYRNKMVSKNKKLIYMKIVNSSSVLFHLFNFCWKTVLVRGQIKKRCF